MGSRKPKDEDTGEVFERDARAAYLAMPGRRSLSKLRQKLLDDGRRPPSLTTLKNWSGEYGWATLAKEHDARVAAKAGDEIAAAQTETAVRRSKVYRDLAERSAEKALAAVDKLKIDKLKASDVRSLAEVSERAGKMAELLEGRATERNENVTRDKLDQTLEEMEREVDERIAKIGKTSTSVH